MTFYHHIALDVLLTPGEKRQIWSIEAKARVRGHRRAGDRLLAIPGTQPGFTLMNENAASPGMACRSWKRWGCPRRVVHPHRLRPSGAFTTGST